MLILGVEGKSGKGISLILHLISKHALTLPLWSVSKIYKMDFEVAFDIFSLSVNFSAADIIIQMIFFFSVYIKAWMKFISRSYVQLKC